MFEQLNSSERPSPLEEVGIGGFNAMVRVSENIEYSNEVPMTPLEDGSVVADHIINNPYTVSISGDVSDVHLRRSNEVKKYLRVDAEIGNLSSQFADSSTQAKLSKLSALGDSIANATRKVQSLQDAGNQAVNFVTNKTPSKPLQQQFLEHMQALYYKKQLITIDMPYQQHDSMMVTLFSADYDNETDSTTFKIDLVKVNFAAIDYRKLKVPAKGLGGQTDEKENKGAQEGKKDTSFIYEFGKSIKGAWK